MKFSSYKIKKLLKKRNRVVIVISAILLLILSPVLLKLFHTPNTGQEKLYTSESHQAPSEPTMTLVPFVPLHGEDPSTIPNIISNIVISLATYPREIPTGWNLPKQNWYTGYLYILPDGWVTPRAGGCGPTYTPVGEDNEKLWINICGPYASGGDEASYEKYYRENHGTILKKENVTIDNTDMAHLVTKSENGSIADEYYLSVWTIVDYAGGKSGLEKNNLVIGYNATSEDIYNKYLPIASQFINHFSFSGKKSLDTFSSDLCTNNRNIIDNIIAQWEHAVYKKNTQAVLALYDRRDKSTLKEHNEEDTIKSQLFNGSYNYNLISYKINGVKVYTSGMCQADVTEERAVKGKHTIDERTFIFSDFNNELVIEGYYTTPENFSERLSGFQAF